MRLKEITFFRWFSLDTAYSFSGHNHDTYEANIVLSGNMNVTIEGKIFELSAGDILFWSPGFYHCNHVGSEKHVEFVSTHFCFEKEDSNEKEVIFYHLSSEDMPLVNMLISKAENSGYGEDSVALSLLEAIIRISRLNAEAPHFFNDSSARVYGKIIKLMDDNSVRTLPTIPEMARICNVSPATLKRTFKKHTGKSIKRYYNDLRIQYAKDMLLEGRSASRVAENLQFSSVSYFSQFFKSKTGMCVREFLSKYK
ncbi:MAG: helix-turn-helix domain-containing protein [Clostridia bacterium]|nr:helix-turn-helix domain-containing protein [Clostridia bacterium]